MSHAESIESHLKEARKFPPPADFAAQAHIRSMDEYERMYRRSLDDPEGFWGEIAREFHWFQPWDKVLEWELPYARWFVGGKTNIAYNCLDRQIERGRGDHPAIIWEGEPGETRTLTFRELRAEVVKFAGVLRRLGVRKGDRVTIYMPMTPELAIAVLACAWIGAPHSVIFAGFSVQAIVDRVEDAESHVVITADGVHRRGAVVPLKKNVDEAAARTALIRTVVVLDRCGASTDSRARGVEVTMKPGRDHWWHELMSEPAAPSGGPGGGPAGAPPAAGSGHAGVTETPPEACDAEDMLYLLYTSGSTGKPKGIVHTTGGYMVYTAVTAKYVFDLKPDDVYWCTADIGWVTGHSYVIYGILANGVTTLMYEGSPNYPGWHRFWEICERHNVTKFYTAPTAIRAFMREGRRHPDKHDLSSIKLLGSVGEPINPEAWMWYHEVIGGGRCPVVDTWWQTETGGIMITPLPGVTPTTPGSATLPFFGVDPAVLRKDGSVCGPNQGGLLCVRRPWPGMLRGIYKDPDRFVRQYWSEIEGVYFAGDSSRRNEDGYFWIMGRVDDVINVSGHRLGTMEIESALVSHAAVAEAAVVGVPHEIKGTGIVAFVTLVTGREPTPELREELRKHVADTIGALARPDQIRFAQALPKTRSGKIMRRLLKEIATSGEVHGDTTTLEDFTVVATLAQQKGEEA